MSHQYENNEDECVEEEEKISAFDRFVKNFAETNLEKRARAILSFLLLIMIITVSGVGFFLTKTFEIESSGKITKMAEGGFAIEIPKKHKAFVTDEMTLLINNKPSKYKLLSTTSNDKNLEVIIKPQNQIKSGDQYTLYLVKRQYWEMLLEKAE